MKVKRTERGWGGHFICYYDCLFRRNTLLEYNNTRVVISTVGAMYARDPYDISGKKRLQTIGYKRFYETMAFMAKEENGYIEADVSREIHFDSDWAIGGTDDAEEFIKVHPYADNEANDMHEGVVKEIERKLINGTLKPYNEEGE
jgi:hypothetical protein